MRHIVWVGLQSTSWVLRAKSLDCASFELFIDLQVQAKHSRRTGWKLKGRSLGVFSITQRIWNSDSVSIQKVCILGPESERQGQGARVRKPASESRSQEAPQESESQLAQTPMLNFV